MSTPHTKLPDFTQSGAGFVLAALKKAKAKSKSEVISFQICHNYLSAILEDGNVSAANVIAAGWIEKSHFIWREDAEALREKIALAVEYYSDETHRANDSYMNLEQVIAAIEARM